MAVDDVQNFRVEVIGAASLGVLGEIGSGFAAGSPLAVEGLRSRVIEGGGDLAHGGGEILTGVEQAVQHLDHLTVVVLDLNGNGHDW